MNLNLRAQYHSHVAARLDAKRKADDYDQLYTFYGQWRALAEELQDENAQLADDNSRTERCARDWKTHAETLARDLARAERVITRQNRVTDQLRFERDYLLGERLRDLRIPDGAALAALAAAAVDEPSAALPIYRETTTAENRIVGASEELPTQEWAPVWDVPELATAEADPGIVTPTDDTAPAVDPGDPVDGVDMDVDVDELQLPEVAHA